MNFDDGDFLSPFIDEIKNIPPPKMERFLRILFLVIFFVGIYFVYFIVQSW